MRIQDSLKKVLPSYLVEKHMVRRLNEMDKRIRETNEKNEYLFWLSQMQPDETMQQTKERVFLRMPKATGRLRNIQLAENYILQRVKDICDANGLELFLVGGTLLGAVRHKGFIPWDNDIDVGMMLSDYRKLVELLKDDPVLRADYYYNYSTGLRIPKIKFRAVDVFWIDVLLFDLIDVTQKTRDAVWEETEKANREHMAKLQEFARPYKGQDWARPAANPEMDRLCDKYEAEQLKNYPYYGHGEYFSGLISTPYWSRKGRGIRSCRLHFPLLKDHLEFEGKYYSVWNNYELTLTQFYGDYWKLPFSINEPHTTELDYGLEEGFAYLRTLGVIE